MNSNNWMIWAPKLNVNPNKHVGIITECFYYTMQFSAIEVYFIFQMWNESLPVTKHTYDATWLDICNDSKHSTQICLVRHVIEMARGNNIYANAVIMKQHGILNVEMDATSGMQNKNQLYNILHLTCNTI